MQSQIELVECPRDAMQGWPHLIPTKSKVAYLQALLGVGFHTLDCGSFVSTKAIPQMADTAEVINQLSLGNTHTKLLAIVANLRGAVQALQFDKISYLGFPFSISPTFQLRNTNSTLHQSFETVAKIQDLCQAKNKQLVVYISMGFGNPYGDLYNPEIVHQWVSKMVAMDIKILSIADTVGLAVASEINFLLKQLIPLYPLTQIGVHLHSSPNHWKPKVEAALDAGCLRFDGALKGIGGCPMAGDDLVGNMDTEQMIPYFEKIGFSLGLLKEELKKASALASTIFV